MTTAERRRRSMPRIIAGAALVVAGVLWLLDASNVVDVPPRAILPIALIIIGVLLIANARHGAHPALITAGAVVAAVLAIGSALAPAGGSFEAFGDRRVRPRQVSEITEYGAAFGRLTVDLTEVPFPVGTTDVEAGVAFGSLVVVVADDIRVTGTVDVTFGDAVVLGRSFDGFASDEIFSDGSSARVVDLDLSVLFGDILVQRAPPTERVRPPTPRFPRLDPMLERG